MTASVIHFHIFIGLWYCEWHKALDWGGLYKSRQTRHCLHLCKLISKGQERPAILKETLSPCYADKSSRGAAEWSGSMNWDGIVLDSLGCDHGWKAPKCLREDGAVQSMHRSMETTMVWKDCPGRCWWSSVSNARSRSCCSLGDVYGLFLCTGAVITSSPKMWILRLHIYLIPLFPYETLTHTCTDLP